MLLGNAMLVAGVKSEASGDSLDTPVNAEVESPCNRSDKTRIRPFLPERVSYYLTLMIDDFHNGLGCGSMTS